MVPKLEIYSPEGLADEAAGITPISPGKPLAGLRVAVLDNGKSGADILLGRMAERLAKRSRAEFVGIHRKGSAATPCEPELLDRLTREADLILTGTAD
jgi:hypothetical protein